MEILRWIEKKVPHPEDFLGDISKLPKLHEVCEEFGKGVFNDYLFFGSREGEEHLFWNGLWPVGSTFGGDRLYNDGDGWILLTEDDQILEVGKELEEVFSLVIGEEFTASELVFFVPDGVVTTDFSYPSESSESLQEFFESAFGEKGFRHAGKRCFVDATHSLFLEFERANFSKGDEYRPRIKMFYDMANSNKEWIVDLADRLKKFGVRREVFA